MAQLVKNPLANAGDTRDHGFSSWVWKVPWRRRWQSTPVFLPGESHGERSLAGYNPQGHKELDMTEHAYTYIHICKIYSQWEFAVWHRSSTGYSVTPYRGGMTWEVGGRFRREETYMYLWLIHVHVWQKPTQHSKAIILQLEIIFKKIYK